MQEKNMTFIGLNLGTLKSYTYPDFSILCKNAVGGTVTKTDRHLQWTPGVYTTVYRDVSPRNAMNCKFILD